MNLSLLAPMGLAALAALLLPLLLHLQRQSEARPTPFAALRWIGARLRPRRRVRFEEMLLLLLRLLLVAGVALLFARPVMTGAGADKPWVGVATTLDAQALRGAQSPASGDDEDDDGKPLANAQWHWLAPGFPSIDEARPGPRQPLSSLLRDVDAQLPPRTAVTAFVPDIVDGQDAERPRLSRKIDWRVVASIGTAGVDAGTSVAGPDAEAVANRVSGSNAANAASLSIRSSADRRGASRYLQAAASALGRSVDAGDTARELSRGARHLAWLAPGSVPPAIAHWTRSGGVLVLDAAGRMDGLPAGVASWRDREGRVLARESSFGRGRVIHLQSALSAQATPLLLDPGFANQFETWLDGAASAPARATALAAMPRTGGQGYKPVPQPVDAWLALLAVALLLLERWVATRAGRGIAP